MEKFILKYFDKFQAFTELQQKMIETTTKLQLADIQIDGLKRQKHHAELTAQEIKVC